MSIDVMTKVWRHFPGNGGQLMCMLTLANWCNDDGGSLHPSISTLAAYMRVSESQARRTLHSLFPKDAAALEAGDWYVRVVDNEGGGAPGTTRHYAVNVQRLEALPSMVPVRETGRMDARGSTGARGRTDARDGSHPCKGTGSMGATRTVIEPLDKPARERARAFEGKKGATTPARKTAFQERWERITAETLQHMPGSRVVKP